MSLTCIPCLPISNLVSNPWLLLFLYVTAYDPQVYVTSFINQVWMSSASCVFSYDTLGHIIGISIRQCIASGTEWFEGRCRALQITPSQVMSQNSKAPSKASSCSKPVQILLRLHSSNKTSCKRLKLSSTQELLDFSAFRTSHRCLVDYASCIPKSCGPHLYERVVWAVHRPQSLRLGPPGCGQHRVLRRKQCKSHPLPLHFRLSSI